MSVTFEILTTPTMRCTRCPYTTTDETHMRSHILDRTCPKDATSYTQDGMK